MNAQKYSISPLLAVDGLSQPTFLAQHPCLSRTDAELMLPLPESSGGDIEQRSATLWDFETGE